MIDGIAVSPQMLQALRHVQRSAPTALSTSGDSVPAPASLHATPSRQLQVAAQGAEPAELQGASGSLPTTHEAQAQNAASDSRCKKRPRIPDDQLSTSGGQGPIDYPASPAAPQADDVISVSGSSNVGDGAYSSDSEDDNAQMEQIIALRQMVDRLTGLSRANSVCIHGFNQNIEELLHSKEVLEARVDALHLQLQQQHIQLTGLQQHMHQMHIQAPPDAQRLQRTASSSCHFDL